MHSTTKGYHCVRGVSTRWENEYHNARGYFEGQVIVERTDEYTHRDECRNRCESDGAAAYNWETSGNHRCRCYGKLAVENIYIDGRGSEDRKWLFCKMQGIILLKSWWLFLNYF